MYVKTEMFTGEDWVLFDIVKDPVETKGHLHRRAKKLNYISL